ncbi:21348_t:CDS:2, partial [Gigaspora margarita]
QISIEQINFKLDVLQNYCLDRWKFYRPTPIFKTRANYDFCEYLVDEIEPLVNSSIVERAQLKDLIYKKRKETKFTDFFYNDVIRVVLRNLYNILNEQDIYIEKYGGHVKNYNYPKNLKYNRDFSYDKNFKKESSEDENPFAKIERYKELGPIWL